MADWVIRRADFTDVGRICEIHNEGIKDGKATLDLEPHQLAEEEAWFQGLKSDEFVLVYEENGLLEGYVSLTRYSPRKCYDGVGVLSIYISRQNRGKGVGTKLMEALFQTAKEMGYRKIILRAFPFNEAGIALYEKMGFQRVGVHKKHGWLHDRWVDIVVMEILFE